MTTSSTSLILLHKSAALHADDLQSSVHLSSDGASDLPPPADIANHQQDLPPNPPPKRPRWLVYLLRLLIAAVVATALLLVSLLYLINTDTGSKFLVEKIALETGVQLKYTEGSLGRGIWLQDVNIAQGEDITVKVNRAYVQFGWRALFARQVHLVNADIDKVLVINKKPATGEPFDYATISLPVALQLDNAKVNEVRYEQAGSDSVRLHSIALSSAKWSGSQVELVDAAVSYGDVVDVRKATGKIDLSGDYPLTATADVRVAALDKVYFDTLSVKASGSLKRTTGSLVSRYNQQNITGSFIAQGLDKNSPFEAKLEFAKVQLPYAEEQNITLTDGVITAAGVVSNIELRINADLTAKDIPSGRYHGRGIVRDGGMDIPFLQANTPQGVLTASGSMQWSDKYQLDATIVGNGFAIRNAMPIEYREYQAYLPQTLTGRLGVKYYLLDENNDTRFEFDLNQQDGERIYATLAQNQDSTDAPWRIDATWANLIRRQVPKIDTINSRQGQLSLRLEEGRTYITADADIDALNAAPRGRYQLQANIEKGERLHLTDFRYQGVMGTLAGTGRLDFAMTNAPLTWQADMRADSLRPNAYFATPNQTPFDTITGRIVATGRMREEGKASVHEISLSNSDLLARLTDGKQVALAGQGSSTIKLQNGQIAHLVAKFDGDVEQDILPQLAKSAVGLQLEGNLEQLTINRASLSGDSGKIVAMGKLSLTQGVDWDIKGKLEEVDTAKFVNNSNLVATLTGDLLTAGSYRAGKLQRVSANFAGRVANNRMTNGVLNFDITGSDSKFVINRLVHQGSAGNLDAAGWLDISRGVAWQLDAKMASLNLAAFVKNLPSKLSGTANIAGSWQDDRQIVDIQTLDIAGTYNDLPLIATGALYAELALPKDMAGYLQKIKQTSRRPTSADELLSLRQRIDSNARQTQNIIRKLTADDLKVQIGDNIVRMAGDESQFTTSVRVVDMGQLIDKTSGAITGGVILINDDNALPTLYIDTTINALRMPNLLIQNAQILGKIVNLGNSDSQLLVRGEDVIALGKVIKAARIDFAGTESEHTLSVATKSGDIEAVAQVAGSLDRKTMRYSGVLSDGSIKSKFGEMTQRQPTEFAYGLGDNSIQVAAHCWQTQYLRNKGEGVICLQDTLSYTPNSGNVNVVVQNLDTQVFSAALPKDIQWQSMLNGRAKASWRAGSKPEVDVVLYSDNGSIGLNQEDTGYVDMPYQRASVIAKSVSKGLQIRTDVLGVAGRGYADVVIDPYQPNKPISGRLAMNELNLAVLRPFFSNLQTLTGRVDLSGRLDGTLKKPLFYGNAKLDQGALAITGVPLALSNIQAGLNIEGTHAVLEGGFVGGEGQGVLTGELDWATEIQVKLGIMGENLSVNRPPLVIAQISPDLEIVIKPQQKFVDIQGVVSIPAATIRPPESTAEIVSESADVSVLDRRMTGNIDQVLAVVEPWNINANIGVDLGGDVEFRGFGARLPLAGALHLTQSGQGVMQALGVIQVSERTKIDAIGQNLDLNYAQIRFDGNMTNPRLSIEGEKQMEGQTVGVRIRGTISSPNITVFNDAGLSEQQAMNALVTGRISQSNDAGITEQGFRSQVTNQLAAAGLSLGLSTTRNLTNQIGQVLGLQSLTIDASGNSEDTNVNVTGYITPDLYIRYGVGVFNAESSLSMRYQLTRRIYIEATSAAENMVDVIYRWKF